MGERNKYNITYKLEMTNDANYLVVAGKSSVCQKCGRVLNEESFNDFCDTDCRREFYAEINKDSNGFRYGNFD